MSSASKGNDIVEQRGLVRSHAYTLISAKKWVERSLYLLKLRNPWGEGEWNGKWSDYSKCWTEEYKKYFGYKKSNDGIFWIDISDYINNFDATYICYILYGAKVRNFYFEYQSYFKKPVIFNLRIKEKSKISVSVLFKGWRFNRDISDLSHPFTLIVCKYDKNRKIEKLWGNWGCKDDINIIDHFSPGYYVVWLYLATKGNNDPNFKYTVQFSSLNDFDIEFLGLDHNFLLIQYLLLENYKKTGETNLESSKDYFIGTDRDLSKIGLSNLLLYNKTGSEIEVMATGKVVTNVQLLPPYEGLKNIKIILPPYESVAIVGIRLSNNAVNFSYSFQLSLSGGSRQNNDPNRWKYNNGDKFANLLKFNIINNNPETMGLRTGEYKYVGKDYAKLMPKFDASKFIGKTILQMSMARPEQITLETLKRYNPKEMQLLLKKYPPNMNEYDKKWDYITNNDGKYLGQINNRTGNLDGKGVFIWNNGVKYIGNWKDGSMSGEGVLFDKNNKLLFEGTYYNNKKYGLGKFFIKENEYYEGEFFDDKMEGKGSYHYENGDIWEGYFKNNMKNGVGIMTFHNTNEVFLYEFENDNYMGSTLLNPQEKAYVRNLQQEERKKLLENEKQLLARRESEYLEQQKKKQKIESGLNKYTNNLYLQKSMIGFGFKITQMNQEVKETQQEKKHRIFLENIELYKKKEPFMMEKFFELKSLGFEEELNLVTQGKNKYLGGMVQKKDGSNNFVMQGRGVLYDGKYYYAGYWDNNEPNGYFNKYNIHKVIT